jgi:dTDP-4-dehydrorhamnose reductase
MTKFFILGINGLLGSRIGNYLKEFDGTFYQSRPSGNGRYHYFDISDANSFKLLIESLKPKIVINCTGFTNVEKCEKFPEKCWSINCSSVVQIAEICRINSIKFVHISTDHFVHFNSKKMSEDDVIFPSNQYSFAKLHAEKMISAINPDSLIIRTNFFEINIKKPRTFLDQMAINIESGNRISSFEDVEFSPISINQLIISILELVKIDYSGIVNIGSIKSISKFDFHNLVLSALNLDKNLHNAVSIDDLLHLAKRPKNMALDITKFVRLTGHEIPAICDMIDEEVAIGRQDAE